LNTRHKAAAKQKLKRILAQTSPTTEDAAREETFQEAAERIVGESDIASKPNRLGRLRNHVFTHIGELPVSQVKAPDIEALLQEVADSGMSHDLVVHVKNDIGAVLRKLWRARLIDEVETERVELPKNAVKDTRERAVLTDLELSAYLAWEHPDSSFAMGVLERQTMACLSRMFGGVRIGDLRALRWEALDTIEGRFTVGWAPRKKTKRPQLLEVPEMLRPILRRWWQLHEEPTDGPVFPTRKGKRAGEEKGRSNVAAALRRDLRRAFGIHAPVVETITRSNGRPDTRISWKVARMVTPRELELFEETDFTKPVDFHSFRRGFKQGLADAGVELQTSMALSGASDAKAHQRYLANTAKMRRVPDDALPNLDMGRVQTVAAGSEPNLPHPASLGCGRNWDRTSGFNRVKVALYR
jgi:integrase